MNLCLCSWLCVLSVSRCVDSPFWPSQSAHLSSAFYDHNDQQLSSWAWSKVSTVQAITNGGLVLLFNKAKTTLPVFGRSWIEDGLRSFQQTAFCFSSQLPFGLFFFCQGGFKPRACFLSVNCSFPLLHTRMGAPTLALVWQRSTFVFLMKQSALFQYNSTMHTIAVTYCQERRK